MIYGQLGQDKAARTAARRILELDPDFEANAWYAFQLRNFPEEMAEHMVEGLRKAGLNIPVRPRQRTIRAASLVDSGSRSAPATGSSKGVINGYVLPISRRAWSSSVTMQSKMVVSPPSDPTRTVPLSVCAVVACAAPVIGVPG
jgi:hypothetical protein